MRVSCRRFYVITVVYHEGDVVSLSKFDGINSTGIRYSRFAGFTLLALVALRTLLALVALRTLLAHSSISTSRTRRTSRPCRALRTSWTSRTRGTSRTRRTSRPCLAFAAINGHRERNQYNYEVMHYLLLVCDNRIYRELRVINRSILPPFPCDISVGYVRNFETVASHRHVTCRKMILMYCYFETTSAVRMSTLYGE